MVEDLDLILETITTVARRCIKKAWPFGPQCDQIDFFFFGSETIFDAPRNFEKSCDNIAQLDWLILLATRSEKGRKSREQAGLANAGKFNRQYLTCQISEVLYADRDDG